MHAKICLAEMQKHLATENKSINDSFTLPTLDAESPINTFDKNVLLATIIRNFSSLPVLYEDPVWFYDECDMWWNQYKYDFAHMWQTNELKYNPINNYDRTEIEKSTPGVTDIVTNSGTDSEKHSGKDTTTPSGTTKVERKGSDTLERSGSTITDVDTLNKSIEEVENSVSAFNETTYQPSTKATSKRTYPKDGGADVPDNTRTKLSHDNDKDINTYGSAVETSYVDAKTELLHGENVDTVHGHVITTTKVGVDQRELSIHGNIGVTSTQQMMEQEYNIRKFNLYTYIANCFADNMCLGIW